MGTDPVLRTNIENKSLVTFTLTLGYFTGHEFKREDFRFNLLYLSVKFTRHVLILSFNHASPINFCRARKSQALISD